MPSTGFLTPVVDERTIPIPRWISLQAELLRRAVADGEPAAARLLHFAGLAVDVPTATLDIDTACLAIAKDHWYADGAEALAQTAGTVDARFEAAADAIQAGDVESLRRLLDAAPELARMRSPFPHHQTLVHHVAANGIEVERQLQSPPNAVEVLRLLLDRGGDPDALCDSYGGGNGSTPLCLLVSSAHPAAAGTEAGLVEELCRGGARVDGLDDDGLPLWTAVTRGHTNAADALARCGARIDNVCFAAALGDLDAVKGYFGADGALRSDVPALTRIGVTGPVLRREHLVEYALIWASAHGRLSVVQFLLTKNPDLRVREPLFRTTALGAARYHGRDDVVALLEPFTREH